MSTPHAYWGLLVVVALFMVLCIWFALYVIPNAAEIKIPDPEDDIWADFKDSTLQPPDNPPPYKHGMPSTQVKHHARNKSR